MSLHVLCTRRLSSATDHKSLCHVPCSRSRTAIRSSFSSQGTTQPAIADGVGPLLLSPSATSETRALHFGKPLSQTQSKAISAFVSQQLRHTLLNTSRIDTLGNAHACAEPGSGAISSQPLTKTTRCVSSRTETTSPRVTHHVTSFPGVCPQPRTSAPQQPPLPPPLLFPQCERTPGLPGAVLDTPCMLFDGCSTCAHGPRDGVAGCSAGSVAWPCWRTCGYRQHSMTFMVREPTLCERKLFVMLLHSGV